MNSFLDNIKAGLRARQAYHLQERDYRIKLNQNESPYDVPDWLKEDIWSEFKTRTWNRYPDFGNKILIEKLAEYCGRPAESILIGNGSNELLQVLMSAVISPGKRVLMVAPTFSVYEKLAHAAEAAIVETEFDEDWRFPVEDIVAQLARQKVDLCILCSPNSPTGSLLQQQHLLKICRATSGLVLLDEAYHEFTESYASNVLPQLKNLIVTRTFSKAVGLAGLRIGYLMADSELVTELNKAKLPYNLNIFSELAAVKLLDNHDIVFDRIREIKQEKQRVLAELRGFEKVTVFPSAGNFYLLSSELAPAVLFERLLSRGVLVRDVSRYHPRLQNTLRVSVGTRSENDVFLEALRQAVHH